MCSIIKLSDGLLSPYLSDLMNAGECTLKNEFAFLYRMYSFYKKELLDNEELITNAKTKSKDKEISRNEMKEIAILVHDKKMKSFYYFYAMMDAFFSLLEHLCVLLLAMDEKFVPSNENIQKFIFDTNWTEKYNRIFQDADIKYKRRYNKLHIVKEKYRNTFAHGAFEKNGNPVFVHVPRVGAVPIALSKYKDSVRSSYLPVKNESYLELIEIFEGFFDDLESDKFFARKYEIIRNTNDIVYNSEYHKKYVDAIKSKKKLKEFFKVQELLLVRYQDMDW